MSIRTIDDVADDPRSTVTEEADFVVVGSGAGGGTAAWKLALEGHDVLLLEEGPPVSKKDFGAATFPAMSKLYRDNMMEAIVGRSMITTLQGRVVGGTTVVNSAIAWRLPDDAYERWAYDPAIRRSFPLDELHRMWDVIDPVMHVSPTELSVAGRGNTLAAEGAAKLGWKGKVMNRYTLACRGAGRCQQGCPNDAKQSTALTMIPEAMRHGMRVLATCLVEKVQFDSGKRAVGVEGRFRDPVTHRKGPRLVAKARKGVILAPGCMQLPGLLRNSGYRHPRLGQHFQAHPGAGLVPVFDADVRYWEGATQGWETDAFFHEGMKFEVINAPIEVNAGRLPGVGSELAKHVKELAHLGSWGVLVRMEAEGSVRSKPGSSARAKLTPTPYDMVRLRKGIHRFAQIAVAAGAKAVMPSIAGLPKVLGADEIDQIASASLDPRSYTMVATHLFGTARAAGDEADGVCDPEFRPWGTRSLWVLDSSPFPRNLGVNPQHMIQATSLLQTERIAASA